MKKNNETMRAVECGGIIFNFYASMSFSGVLLKLVYNILSTYCSL